MDCDTEFNRFTFPNGEIKLLKDVRPNHFSEYNHKIFSEIILNFFMNYEDPYIEKNSFKTNHLNEKSNFISLNTEFIYG